LAERALRQVVVGRANWQFCGSAEGARTAAALFSMVSTCKHLRIDPFDYLREALPALFGLGQAPGEEALACWLPDVWQERRRATSVPDARHEPTLAAVKG
jgi:transposase